MIRRKVSYFVERPRPVPKGLKRDKVSHLIKIIVVERPCPVSKGLKRFTNCINILKVTVERHRPAPKGLKQSYHSYKHLHYLSKDPALLKRDSPSITRVRCVFYINYTCQISTNKSARLNFSFFLLKSLKTILFKFGEQMFNRTFMERRRKYL